MVGSIWIRNWPCFTKSPSCTAICVIRPVMSAETSTFFLGWILPLAVTAATRSRRPTVSNRTSWPRSRRAPALIATIPTMSTAAPAPTSTLLRLDMAVGSPGYRSGFERGHRLVIVVHGVDVVGLGAQPGDLGVEQLEERPRADAVALRGELQLLARCGAVRVLNGDRLKRRLERQVRLAHIGFHLEPARPHRFLQILLLRLGLRHQQRLMEVAPQWDRDGESRLERLRGEMERIAAVQVAERLLLGRRVGEQRAVDRRLARVQPRAVLVSARHRVGLSALADGPDRRVDVRQLLREPGPAGRQRHRRTPARRRGLHTPPRGALPLAQCLE